MMMNPGMMNPAMIAGFQQAMIAASQQRPYRYVCSDGVARNAPPAGYMCHRCGQAGHWKQDCPMGARPNDVSGVANRQLGLPGPGYVCKICNVPGHWIRDCPQRRQQEAR